MTTNGWVGLVVGVVCLLLVAGAYLILRDWRESRAQRGQQEYQPPEPSSPSPASSLPPTGSKIQWGRLPQHEETPPPPSGSELIQWGEAQNQERAEGSPISDVSEADDEGVRCPICRLEIEQTTAQVIKCPGCDSLYHQSCLAELDSVCRNCGKELS